MRSKRKIKTLQSHFVGSQSCIMLHFYYGALWRRWWGFVEKLENNRGPTYGRGTLIRRTSYGLYFSYIMYHREIIEHFYEYGLRYVLCCDVFVIWLMILFFIFLNFYWSSVSMFDVITNPVKIQNIKCCPAMRRPYWVRIDGQYQVLWSDQSLDCRHEHFGTFRDSLQHGILPLHAITMNSTTITML